jgi:DNA polymerase elongation subunit (family B)
VAEVNAVAREYNGKITLVINKCTIVESENIADYSPASPTLVFDIETIGKKFEDLDKVEQDYLLNTLEKNEEEETAKKKTGLYSIFGSVCAIGCYSPTSRRGMVLSISNQAITPGKKDFEYLIYPDEKSLLEGFWQIAKSYEKFVTYNGESFDFPYLVIRSGINRVKVPITIKKWSDNFIDLQQKIKQRYGFKLEMLCKAFGIENPKEAGVHGKDVNDLFEKKEYNKIADYVARDAYSTSLLYDIWRQYMSGETES